MIGEVIVALLLIASALLGWLVGVLWRVGARPSSTLLVLGALVLGWLLGMAVAENVAQVAHDIAADAVARIVLGGR